jgi:hypothetical protein
MINKARLVPSSLKPIKTNRKIKKLSKDKKEFCTLNNMFSSHVINTFYSRFFKYGLPSESESMENNFYNDLNNQSDKETEKLENNLDEYLHTSGIQLYRISSIKTKSKDKYDSKNKQQNILDNLSIGSINVNTPNVNCSHKV